MERPLRRCPPAPPSWSRPTENGGGQGRPARVWWLLRSSIISNDCSVLRELIARQTHPPVGELGLSNGFKDPRNCPLYTQDSADLVYQGLSVVYALQKYGNTT